MGWLTLLLLVSSGVGNKATPPTRAEISDAVQRVLDRTSAQFNMSFQFGFASGDQLNEVFGLAAGLDDRCLKQPCKQTMLTPHTLIPAGSVTKAWTGAATLRFVDKGVLGLDNLAHTLVDPVLARQGQPTMAELWDGNAQVNRITVRDLLAMTSGIADYNDGPLAAWTIVNAGKDLDPFALINLVDKKLTCRHPPCPPFYSSINYVLLGLLNQGLQQLAAWQDWDQLAAAVHPSRKMQYNETSFPKAGKCLSYPVAHQYARQTHPAPVDAPDEPDTVMFYDMIDYSCLNGWSMGNIAASSKDLAMFFRDLFGAPRHGAILKPDTVAAMMHWQNLTNEWTDGYAERGVWYGLATYRSGEFGFLTVPGTGDSASTILYGHPGADWGSLSSPVCGYNPAYKFGICVVYNSAIGMNCTDADTFALSQNAGSIASCLVYAAVLQLYGGPWLDCYEYPNLFPSGRAAYSGNKNAPNEANRASGGSGSKPRSKAAGWGADKIADIAATAPVACEWKPDYSICDMCRSALCHSCKVCEHSTTGDCAPCREGIMPCIPLCVDHACW